MQGEGHPREAVRGRCDLENRLSGVGVKRLIASVIAMAALLGATGPAQAQRPGGGGEDLRDPLRMLEEALNPSPEGVPQPLTDEDFHPRNEAAEELGRLLFFDKILSGNMNISCATCHHPLTDTGDGLSLPVGEGGKGLGMTRNTGDGADAIHERVPRNAPALFNLGAKQFTVMFHDGRLEVDPSQPSGFISPAGDDLPMGLDNALAAQAMFPVTSAAEMAGQPGENPVADAAAAGNLAGPGGVWEQLALRIQAFPEYVNMFIGAFDDVEEANDITFVHVANALSAYQAGVFRADDSRFDRWLRGEKRALSRQELTGMRIFYSSGRCSECHSGPLQTDMQFHAIGMPQIGPGKGDNLPGFNDGLDDFGRGRETGDPADMFRFRTPSLRNVAVTGPWGHSGAYNTLEAVVRHHLDPAGAMANYDQSQVALPSRPDLDALDFVCINTPERAQAIMDAVEIEPVALSEQKIKDLIAFLHALTDPASLDMRHDVPAKVPSGLPMYD